MLIEYHFSKDSYSGLGFIAKGRSGSGDDYRSSFLMRGKDPGDPQLP